MCRFVTPAESAHPHADAGMGPLGDWTPVDRRLTPARFDATLALCREESHHGPRDLPRTPLLAVEVRSPSTGGLEEGRKRSLYEESGVAHHWLVNPEAPSITVLQLVDGRYVEVAKATVDRTTTLDSPLPVTLNPAELARG